MGHTVNRPPSYRLRNSQITHIPKRMGSFTDLYAASPCVACILIILLICHPAVHAACDAVHLRSVGCAILPRLFSPASWLRDLRLLLSALQYKSRIAMRTWRRTLPKQMTILHALLRRGCSWKPHCLNNFETACSCLLLCFFVAWLSSSSYVMNASICLEHTHTHLCMVS